MYPRGVREVEHGGRGQCVGSRRMRAWQVVRSLSARRACEAGSVGVSEKGESVRTLFCGHQRHRRGAVCVVYTKGSKGRFGGDSQVESRTIRFVAMPDIFTSKWNS